jgi:hypothetical protein
VPVGLLTGFSGLFLLSLLLTLLALLEEGPLGGGLLFSGDRMLVPYRRRYSTGRDLLSVESGRSAGATGSAGAVPAAVAVARAAGRTDWRPPAGTAAVPAGGAVSAAWRLVHRLLLLERVLGLAHRLCRLRRALHPGHRSL